MKLQWRPGLGGALDRARRRLRDVRQGPGRLGPGLGEAVPLLGGEPPETPHFELFMDEHNQKISKTKGNGLTMEDVAALRRAREPRLLHVHLAEDRPSGSISTSSRRRPTSTCSSWTPTTGRAPRARTRPTRSTTRSGASTAASRRPRARRSRSRLLLNLVSAANASDKAILWGFLSRYLPGASAGERADARPPRRLRDPLLRGLRAAGEDASAPPTSAERAAFADLVRAAEGAAGRLPGRRGDPERGLRGRQGRPASSRCAPGSRRSTRCCWARARARASAPSPRSSGWRSTIALIEKALA